MEQKTNVMRILDRAKIKYQSHFYEADSTTTGEEVAQKLNQNPDQVCKTLVTIGKSKKYYVFVIPVNKQLDLKKAAEAVLEKSIEMIKTKELLGITGYVHGGCSPIGMKKQFGTTFQKGIENFETIIFSGGKIGAQVELHLVELESLFTFTLADLVI